MAKEQRLSLLLRVYFQLPRDEQSYAGVVSNFSRSHIVFATRKAVVVGQDMHLTICKVENGTESAARSVAAVVEATKVQKNGSHLLTARFAPEKSIDTSASNNRRIKARYMVDLPGRFRQGHEKHWSLCKVIDVSSTGVKFQAERAVRENCSVDLVILTKSGSPMGKVVHGEVNITRCRHRGGGNYESAGFYEGVNTEDPVSDSELERLYPTN